MVLIVGGNDGSGGFFAAAELYDPASGTFSATGNLNQNRAQHTATLLNNGMVLVAGGYGVIIRYPPPFLAKSLSSAELYNPGTGTFSLTGSLNTARDSHTGALLANGNVLASGGRDYASKFSVTFLSSAELYQPATLTPPNLLSIALTPSSSPWLAVGSSLGFTATGTFSGSGPEQLASVTWSSSNTSVAAITNDATNHGNAYGVAAGTTTITACAGSICGSTTLNVAPHENLILGSACGHSESDTFELHDDSGNLLQQGSLSNPLSGPSATRLQNGTIFVAGGANQSDCIGGSTLWQIFTPGGQVLSSGSLQDQRVSSFAVLLGNGNVFIGGGSASPGTWEIENPTGAAVSSGNLNNLRAGGESALLLQNGNVWISGGSKGSGTDCTYEIHDLNGALVSSGSLNTCFSGGKVKSLPNGNVMLLGGDNAPGTWEIRTETGAFVSTGSLTNAFNSGSGSVLLTNGNVFIFGSCLSSCGAGGSPGAWEIRGETGNFVATGSLQSERASAGATVLSNGNIFITGGNIAPGSWEIRNSSGGLVSSGNLFDTRYAGHSLTHF